MWALQLVDQAGEETQPQRDDPSPGKSLNSFEEFV